ncbi:division/cell wall cluster transcriptional repressor MraZ [candidate division KSB1 bacterium]|nr:division/cell wall cluster transcriptional repressor MraZ [candidate division KSB1 bacterium]
MDGLLGTYFNAYDPKGRVAIPVKIRNAFPEGQQDRVYITRGIEPCITGYCQEEWDRFRYKLNKAKIDEKTKRKLKREFIGRGAEAVFDKQGRITIPQDLIAYAGLQDLQEVIVVGADNYIEIWNPANYQRSGAASEEDVEAAMSVLDLDEAEYAAGKEP